MLIDSLVGDQTGQGVIPIQAAQVPVARLAESGDAQARQAGSQFLALGAIRVMSKVPPPRS